MTDTRWFGHPRGLSTLFFTEMWERFSYYGMRAILVLFMTNAVATGGMGLDDVTATAIYGLYTAAVYVVALPGGWIADRLLGLRRAVFWGGTVIALGHFTLAVPNIFAFYTGLTLIVIGTGLLKPNISAIVGDLYPEGGARRDAGFSIYYMGINVGGFLGPLVCGYLGEAVDWHLGFGAAGVGMVLGLIQYSLGGRHLGTAGELRPEVRAPEKRAAAKRALLTTLEAVVGLALIVGTLQAMGAIRLSLVGFVDWTGLFIVSLAGFYLLYVVLFGGLTTVEKKRVGVIAVCFLAAACFWSGFEQAGSSMNLFAERLTDRIISGWEMPASWLQSVNGIFIILLAPLFSALWIWLGATKSVDPREDGVRADVPRRGVRGARVGLGQCHARKSGQPKLARRHVFLPHDRRAMPEPDRTQQHHAALARALRGTDDGHLVHGRGAGQPCCGPRGWTDRIAAAAAALRGSDDVLGQCRVGAAGVFEAFEGMDRRRAVTLVLALIWGASCRTDAGALGRADRAARRSRRAKPRHRRADRQPIFLKSTTRRQKPDSCRA